MYNVNKCHFDVQVLVVLTKELFHSNLFTQSSKESSEELVCIHTKKQMNIRKAEKCKKSWIVDRLATHRT